MELIHELRQKAHQFRQLASIPTTGGREADRVLVALAERLEHEAQDREQGLVLEDPI